MRLNSSRFLDAARAMPYLSSEDAELAKLWFCQELTQRQLCAKLSATCHWVRKRLEQVGAQIAIIHRMSRSKALSGQAG